MDNLQNKIPSISTLTPTPRYPTGNVALPESVISVLAEQIAIAAMQVQDPQGLKISAMGDMSVLPNLAAQIVGAWLHCGVYIEYELKDDVDG